MKTENQNSKKSVMKPKTYVFEVNALFLKKINMEISKLTLYVSYVSFK